MINLPTKDRKEEFEWIRLLKIIYYHRYGGYLPNFAILFLFQKVPFDMDFIWKMKMKSSFFIWNIKKTCAARGSLRSSHHPSLPPPTNPTPTPKKWIIQIKNFHFCYQKNKHNSIFSKCKKVNQLMHFIFTKSTK